MTNPATTTERKRRRKPAAPAEAARPETDAAQEEMPLLRAGTAAPAHAPVASAEPAPAVPEASGDCEAHAAPEAAEPMIPDGSEARAEPAELPERMPAGLPESTERAEPLETPRPKRSTKTKKAASAQASEPAPAEVPAEAADGLPDPADPEAIRAEAMRHGHRVAVIAAALFQDTASLHGLSDLWAHRLHHAALLHDIGYVEGRKGHHKTAMRMIETGAAPWIEDEDRPFVALLARYHRKAWPSRRHARFDALKKSDRKALRKAASLLRIADALDYTHTGVVGNLAVAVKKRKVIIAVQCSGDCSAEMERVIKKGDLFMHVFGRELECVCQGN